MYKETVLVINVSAVQCVEAIVKFVHVVIPGMA